MRLTITKAINGFVLEYYDEDCECDRFISVEDPSDGDETITSQKLLWEIQEFFGIFGDKHNVKVRVIREKNGKEIR